MKLTSERLKRIIKEELSEMMSSANKKRTEALAAAMEGQGIKFSNDAPLIGQLMRQLGLGFAGRERSYSSHQEDKYMIKGDVITVQSAGTNQAESFKGKNIDKVAAILQAAGYAQG